MSGHRSNHRYAKQKEKRERRFALKVAQEETGRACGNCTACCMVLGVAEVPTRFYTPCPHQTATQCTIYDKRPGACRDFYCEWLVGALTNDDRPDRLGLVFVSTRAIDAGQSFDVVAAYEVWPGAAGSERAQTILRTSQPEIALIEFGHADIGRFVRSNRVIQLRIAAAVRPRSSP